MTQAAMASQLVVQAGVGVDGGDARALEEAGDAVHNTGQHEHQNGGRR